MSHKGLTYHMHEKRLGILYNCKLKIVTRQSSIPLHLVSPIVNRQSKIVNKVVFLCQIKFYVNI